MKRKLILFFLLILLVGTMVHAQAWPKKLGAFTSISGKAIPAFPKTLREFRFSGRKKDYFGDAFESTGTVRVFEGNEWETIYDGATEFPHTMNSCGKGEFMVRWRSANPQVKVLSAVGYLTDNITFKAKAANYGYLYGTNCQMPLFKFANAVGGNESTLVDIYYEVKFWEAAP